MSPPLDPDLLRDLEAARAAAETPPWVRVLLGLLAGLVHSMQEQMRALGEQLASVTAQLQEQREQNALLRKQLFGARSERAPKPRTSRPARAPRADRPARNGPSALDSASLDEEQVTHRVPDSDRCCPQCGGSDFVELAPEISREFELEVTRLIRRLHHRQKLACRCGGHIVTAPGPERVTEGGQFGPTLHADTVVRRCMDAIPLNRMADMYRRSGVPLSVSTLNDLFHATAEKLEPLYRVMKKELLQAAVVHADARASTRAGGTRAQRSGSTQCDPHRVLAPGKCDMGYLWSFSSDTIVYFVHAADRSGATPRELLADSGGFLVADGHSGYNVVEGPKSRTRAGCMAHARRKFVEAESTDPTRAAEALAIIASLYRVEAELRARGSDDRLERQAMRDRSSRPLMEILRHWLDQHHDQVRPQSPIGRAITYARKQWGRLCVFLEDPDVPIDNNEAERHLRRPVLGRKTSLFVANHDSGKRYAINYSIVLTCRKAGINPTEYLTWLLTTIDRYPSRKIADLLPANYAQTRARLAATAS